MRPLWEVVCRFWRRVERPIGCWSASLVLVCWSAAALSQGQEAESAYPSKPVRVIVPYAPGSVPDRLARVLGQKMNEAWNQPVVVENRPGAGGAIAAEAVARSAPDGYTILFGTPSTQVTNALVFGSKLSYDPQKDFAPISHLVNMPSLLLLNPAVPANSMQELIALAKARPGVMNYASAGINSTGHVAGELLKSLAQIDIAHIPASSPSQALQDVVSGRVEMMFDTAVLALPLVQAGKLKALAVTSERRLSAAPDLPTIAETIPGYQITLWFAAFARSGTPAPIIAKLNREIVRIMSLPDTRKILTTEGMEIVASSPEALAAHVDSEIVKLGKIIKVSKPTN